MIDEVPVYAHFFRGLPGDDLAYWRDVGTIEAYFDANMDLCSVKPQLNLYRTDWSTYTLWHNDPPAKTVFSEEGDGRRAEVLDSLLSPGVVVSGAKVHRSLLSNRVYVDEHSEVDECILLRGASIGKGCRIRRAIIDKWNEVPDGAEIGFDPEADKERFTVSPSGIVVVPSGYRWS